MGHGITLQDQVLTDMDVSSTPQPDQKTITSDPQSASPDQNDDYVPTGRSYSNDMDDCLDDQKSSRGSDPMVPDVSDSENENGKM